MNVYTTILLASCMIAVQAFNLHDAPALGQHCAELNGLNITMDKEITNGMHLKNPSANIIQHIICSFTGATWLTGTGDWDKESMKTSLTPVLPVTALGKVIECAVKKATIEETALEFWKCANPAFRGHVYDKDNLIRKE